jgi:hypothetical protein
MAGGFVPHVCRDNEPRGVFTPPYIGPCHFNAEGGGLMLIIELNLLFCI